MRASGLGGVAVADEDLGVGWAGKFDASDESVAHHRVPLFIELKDAEGSQASGAAVGGEVNGSAMETAEVTPFGVERSVELFCFEGGVYEEFDGGRGIF